LRRLEQLRASCRAFGGDLARFDYLSARPSNPTSQDCRSRAVTFLRFAPMQRTSDPEDQLDDRELVDVSELIARISAERGHPIEDGARHRLLSGADDRRSRRRRLAPAIVGVAAVLVASGVALTLRTVHDAPAGPQLDTALVGAGATSTPAPPPATEKVPAPTATAASLAPSTPPRPAVAPVKPAAPVVDDGVQAATAHGWKLVARDEFAGALSTTWKPYEGEGNSGKGRRSPDAISVRSGVAVIHGDAKGTTGGMAWADDRRTGRWEMRARFPKGDAQYHPVLLLWPQRGGSDDGEVDFAETTSAASSVSFFLHHGSGDQESAKKQIDITQWHNYAVEVTSTRVTGYVDGQKWFESTSRDTLPRGPVHPAIQLDWFPKGDSPEPSDLLVDWMRIYQ
jgi:hypothetical protein